MLSNLTQSSTNRITSQSNRLVQTKPKCSKQRKSHDILFTGCGGGNSSNSTESGAGLESPSIQALDLGEGAAVLLVRRRGQVAVGAEGAAGGAGAVCIFLQVHVAGELVEAAGVDAEAEDEADGHQHQHDERADAARLARAAAHLALSSSVVLAAGAARGWTGVEPRRGKGEGLLLLAVGWVRSGTGRGEGPRSGLVCLGVRARPSGDATNIKEGGGELNQVRSYRQIGLVRRAFGWERGVDGWYLTLVQAVPSRGGLASEFGPSVGYWHTGMGWDQGRKNRCSRPARPGNGFQFFLKKII
jgi:hypothetical protein